MIPESLRRLVEGDNALELAAPSVLMIPESLRRVALWAVWRFVVYLQS